MTPSNCSLNIAKESCLYMSYMVICVGLFHIQEQMDEKLVELSKERELALTERDRQWEDKLAEKVYIQSTLLLQPPWKVIF